MFESSHQIFLWTCLLLSNDGLNFDEKESCGLDQR